MYCSDVSIVKIGYTGLIKTLDKQKIVMCSLEFIECWCVFENTLNSTLNTCSTSHGAHQVFHDSIDM